MSGLTPEEGKLLAAALVEFVNKVPYRLRQRPEKYLADVNKGGEEAEKTLRIMGFLNRHRGALLKVSRETFGVRRTAQLFPN